MTSTLRERLACTCAPRPERRHTAQICPACEAWEHGRVVLQDGTLMAKTLWIQAHALGEEERGS